MTRQDNDLNRFLAGETRKGVRFLDPACEPPLGIGVKYDRNPVLFASAPTHHICHPQVIRKSGRLYMFYVHYDEHRPPNAQIDLATSQDGLVWKQYEGNPVLAPSEGQWDGRRTSYHSIVKVRDTYYMYYTGTAQQGTKNCMIGMATSKDLLHWEKYSGNPLFAHLEAGLGQRQVQVPCVFVESEIWYLYYMEQDGQSGDITLATSSDGLHWTRDRGSPVLRTNKSSWDSLRISPQNVLRYANKYYMFYNGFAGDVYSSGIAVSEDLRNWGKYESNPIFTVTRPESWESRIVDHQFCLPFEDRYYVWYSGANDISQHVGLAFLAASPVTSEKVEIHKGKNGSA